ncbi:urease accessory protein UreF [Paracoccus pacificus]|uniref:Urease accessory protein UreF n=1 Tax=Paracoccus pacificus TaxID=1463598 RepID=A0ABW4R334_9RHOB
MSTAEALSLIQWLSPAFPTGGFAYSHGLEQAMAGGAVTDAAQAAAWVGDILAHGSGWNDAVLLACGLRGDDLGALSEHALALSGSSERWIETRDQGRAFAATVSAITGRDLPPRPLPVALAEAARPLNLPPAQVIGHYLHGFAANLIGAATRFLPLGQAQAQAALAGLHPLIAELAARAADSGLDDPHSSTFAAELAAMQHETLQPRIFLT